MGILTIAYVVLGFAEDPMRQNLANDLVWGMAAFFFLEFTLRCLDDQSPRRYVRDHWIDLVTCIPAIGPLRLVRLLRLLRIFNMAGWLKKLARDRGDAASTAGLRLLGATVFAFWLLSGYAFYVTELDQPRSMVHSFTDALFLAFTTISTVGYSPIKAVTYDGQIVAGLAIFIGFGLLTAASGRLTSLWTEGSREADQAAVLLDVRDHLRRSEARFAALEAALELRSTGPAIAGLPTIERPSGTTSSTLVVSVEEIVAKDTALLART